jgi:hypothetical protein
MSKLTKYGNKKKNLSTYCGTIDFMAPEVLLNEKYDISCDIWSIGVIAYVMLSGYLPFQANTDLQIKNKIITTDY